MRHQPALEAAGQGRPAKRRPAAARQGEALCLMLDGTWQLVKVAGWQKDDGGRWRCLLQWGVWGTVYEGWYLHDPGKVIPAGNSA
jgi:hypothetical protein